MSVIGQSVEFEGIEGTIVTEQKESYRVEVMLGRVDQCVFVEKDLVEDQLEEDR